MPRGQQPEAERPLSNAERQARYRARRDAQQAAPVIRYRRPTDRRTRAQRWHDTVAGLISLKAEYDAWHEALPDSLRDTATGAALQAIVDLGRFAAAGAEDERGLADDQAVAGLQRRLLDLLVQHAELLQDRGGHLGRCIADRASY